MGFRRHHKLVFRRLKKDYRGRKKGDIFMIDDSKEQRNLVKEQWLRRVGKPKDISRGKPLDSGEGKTMEIITINGKEIMTSDDFDILSKAEQKEYMDKYYAAHPVPTDFPVPTPARNFDKAKRIVQTLPPDERVHLEAMLDFDPTNTRVIDYILGLKK